MFLRFSMSRALDAVTRFRGQPVQRNLDEFSSNLKRINQLEAEVRNLSQAQIRTKIDQFKVAAKNHQFSDEAKLELFAVVREAARRELGQRPFDEQILAGLVLADGRVAEMQTGEGKTLAAVAPTVCYALSGRGIHVLTVNDYLAHRDAVWMSPVYDFLGISVGFIQEGMSPEERRAAYGKEVTYVTAKEAGFDVLRDHLCLEEACLVHRELAHAIVDEADSILVDEARVPLVVAGDQFEPSSRLADLAHLARRLERGVDFDTDEYARNINLTEHGVHRVEEVLGCGNLFTGENIQLLAEVRNAIHAEYLLRRDFDYIVRNQAVELVDEFTGRVVVDRQWPDGLQAAIEAKEKLEPKPEGRILGSIAIQHLMKLYPRLAGMTGTAQPAAKELHEFYGLDVVVIPTHCPCIRVDDPDVVFANKEAKTEAVVEEIAATHASSRPVLVGTASVSESEDLAARLRERKVRCRVLNAKNDQAEAEIVAEAGKIGAVTISTNMAGRGTDIRLGGADESNRTKVAALGGLYVIGTNRHESRRIDDQLRGRAGRQGDPGASRFFISVEDDLISRFGIDDLLPMGLVMRGNDEPLQGASITREVSRAQRIVEGQDFEMRLTLCRYADVVEKQRRFVQDWRQDLLRKREQPTLLREGSGERWRSLLPSVGEEALQEIERRITLVVVDRCWSDYLAAIAEIRDGIHLTTIGGLKPFEEFHSRVRALFENLLVRIDEWIVEVFETIEITSAGVDWEREGLTGPSSTWTYLVTDQPFKTGPLAAISSRQSIGAPFAALFSPVLIAWMAFCRWRRARGKPVAG